MRILLLAAVVLLSTVCRAEADSANGPLQVTAPSGWTQKYDNSKGIQFYTITEPLTKLDTEHPCFPLLMFSRWPAGGGPEKIPGFIDSMATLYPTMIAKNPMLKINDTVRGNLTGDMISGQYVEFHMNHGISQVMYMFSDGETIWQGQFTGSAESWKIAQKILMDIKKNG